MPAQFAPTINNPVDCLWKGKLVRECVRGKLTRFYIIRHFGRFFSSKSLFITFEVLGCNFVSILHKKCVQKTHFYLYKTPVNTQNNLVDAVLRFLI